MDSDNAQPVSHRFEGRVVRVWPAWLRILLAVAVVLLFFKLYAGWHWSERVGSGPGVTFSPTKAYVGLSSAMALVVEFMSERLNQFPVGLSRLWPLSYWHLAFTLGTVLPASLIGVAVFALLTQWFGPAQRADSHCRCRRCDYILNGLSQPRCPECGESI